MFSANRHADQSATPAQRPESPWRTSPHSSASHSVRPVFASTTSPSGPPQPQARLCGHGCGRGPPRSSPQTAMRTAGHPGATQHARKLVHIPPRTRPLTGAGPAGSPPAPTAHPRQPHPRAWLRHAGGRRARRLTCHVASGPSTGPIATDKPGDFARSCFLLEPRLRQPVSPPAPPVRPLPQRPPLAAARTAD
jgi:hypothetical protein